MLSLRRRLTLWYSLMLLCGLIALAATTWFAVSHLLKADIDASLAKWMRGAEETLEKEAPTRSINRIQDEFLEYAMTLPGNSILQVLDQDDTDLSPRRSVNEPRLPVLGAGDHLNAGVYSTIQITSQDYRVLAQAIVVEGHVYRIQIAEPLGKVDTLMRHFGIILIWIAPLVLMVASLGGYWISLRALAPVDTMTAAARAIGIHNLSQRLKIPHVQDELQRLSQTFNEMLDRLEAAVSRLSQFTADASHELRSPIALIRTTAEIALSQQRSPEAYRAALQQVVLASERVSSLVEDLLELARSDTGRTSLPFARTDLGALAIEVHHQCLPLAGAKQVSLTVDIPTSGNHVAGNEMALRRLIVILVENAIKFTRPGGSVNISTTDVDGIVTLRVRDTGIGIPQTVLPHIFERFYRADRSRNREGGTGLGLSIAQAIARAHEATIQVKSEVGVGSDCSIQFKCAPTISHS